MRDSNVTLVVPKPLHKIYPNEQTSGVKILTVQDFIDTVRDKLD